MIEHLILHAIIASETNRELGYSGYECYLKEMVEEWFTTDMVPKPNWMKLAYQRAFLTSKQTNKQTNSIIRLLENGPLKRVNELIREQDRMLHIVVHDFNDLWHDSSGNLSMFWALYSDDDFNDLWEKVKIETSTYIDNDSLLKHDIGIIFKDYLYSPEEAARINNVRDDLYDELEEMFEEQKKQDE